MPKKGKAVCLDCNEEIEGIFPDNKPGGYNYSWPKAIKQEIDRSTAERMRQHHRDYRVAEHNARGHNDFDVFLDDGMKGQLEVVGYSVTYRELGKER